MLLLALIAEEPCYGYEMVQKLSEQGLELVSEGSIYPVLKRLEHDSLIESYFVPSEMGPNRKYYRISPLGKIQLEQWKKEWYSFSRSVQQVLQKGVADDDGERTIEGTNQTRCRRL